MKSALWIPMLSTTCPRMQQLTSVVGNIPSFHSFTSEALFNIFELHVTGFCVTFCKGILLTGTTGSRSAGMGRSPRCCRKPEREDAPPAERGDWCRLSHCKFSTNSIHLRSRSTPEHGLWWTFLLVH